MVSIDLVQMILTIWGSSLLFGSDESEVIHCMLQMPSLVNFMLVLIILNYLMILRLPVTFCHFKYGG